MLVLNLRPPIPGLVFLRELEFQLRARGSELFMQVRTLVGMLLVDVRAHIGEMLVMIFDQLVLHGLLLRELLVKTIPTAVKCLW